MKYYAVIPVALVALIFSHELMLPTFSQPPSNASFVITGASSGIGLSAALKLSKEGYTVYAGVRRDSDADKLRGMGIATLRPVMLDVNNETHIQELLGMLVEQDASNPLHGLVNNGGIGYFGPLELIAAPKRQLLMDTNLNSVIRLTSALLPLLKKHPGSRIVNIGSTSGERSPTWGALYAASKFGL